ncbi:PREDICTED: zinc finger protein 280D isoform X2 [Gekko japonicus]|uniref:Zinc finger protein 280D isoform X2 n=1 Tax=Gekko japonicus TaxID=146911 RepID=A0ABM1JT99_GEKJA|nr:PREDICTED: zinc finger protein 280D isoform X2 [Gekko japonicus]
MLLVFSGRKDILNRVHPSSPRTAVQNGTPKRGFQPLTRPAASTLAVQPQPRAGSLSGTSPGLQKPLPGGSSPQEAAKPSAGISQPVSRSAPTPSISGNLNIPAMAPSAARPVATVTAQPAALHRAAPTNTSSIVFGIRQNSGAALCPSGAAVTTTGLAKRPASTEVSSVSPKKAKAEETGTGSSPPVAPSVRSPNEMPLLQKGVASCNTKNGATFPQACPKCNIHFNLLDPLKNHMKYCCPELVHTFLGSPTTDSSGASAKIAESERGKLIMLVNDFYYGKYEGNIQQVHQEQKTHTTFKCASCMKLLKNNIRFMNHMKHHLELEKQESWESHTTCQHCFRQFPTPFQLQCHIESTHTPHESSTVCRICELSFETEQILLQHMKDNHRPGEMPYVCQVCNYRSSAFSDVEKHFRAVHENTKNLLCPFCLKVVKIGAPYMHHYMRHQKKGVHRCTKCRLQFLTCKEKLDHKSQHHRTFRKPPQLEGLPPGTKVTIRASAGSIPPGSVPATPVVGPSTSTLQLSPHVKATNTKNYNKLNVSKGKPKPKPWSKRLSTGTSGLSSGGGSGSGSGSKKNNKIANTALNNLRCSEIQKCIECSADIRTFASHFPAYVHCSLCRYSTSCSKAYVNHMMSFHSARQSKRFWIYKARSEELRGTTTFCLNCDYVTDDSGLDKMATHLNERQYHRCQVIVENVSSEDVATEDLSDPTDGASLSNEGEDQSQNLLSRPDPPEGQEGTPSAPASPVTKNSAEGTDKAQLDPGDETSSADQQEEKAPHPSQDHPPSPVPSAPSEEGSEGCLEGQEAEGAAAAGSGEPASPSAPSPPSGLGGQTFSEGPAEGGEAGQTGNPLAEGAAAAGSGEPASPSAPSPPSGLGGQTFSEGPAEGGEAGQTGNPLAEGAAAAGSGEPASPSAPSPPSGLGGQTFSEGPAEGGEAGQTGNPLAEGAAAAGSEEAASPLTPSPTSGLGSQTFAEEPMESGETGQTRSPLADSSAAAGSEEPASPLAPGSPSGLEGQTFAEEPMGSGEVVQTGSPLAEGATTAEGGGEGSSPSASGECSGPRLSACSEDPGEPAKEGSLRNQLAEGAVVAEGGEEASPSVLEHSASPRLAAHSEDLPQVPAGEGNTDSHEDRVAGSPAVDECEGNASVAEPSSGLAPSASSEDLGASAEEAESSGHRLDESCAAAPCGGGVAPSTPEPPSHPGLPACLKNPGATVEETPGGHPEGEAKEMPVAAESLERVAASLVAAGSSDAGLQAPSQGSEDPVVAQDSPGRETEQSEGSSSVPAAGDGSDPGAPPNDEEGAGCDASETGDQTGERISKGPTGDHPCSSSEDQQPVSDVEEEEAELEDVDADPSGRASDSDVSFEQFLRRQDEPESVSSDVSEQGSVHLEPLTPSEVLEHEATEILQKGGPVASSSKTSGPGSEQAEAGASREGSPSHGEAAASPAEESATDAS